MTYRKRNMPLDNSGFDRIFDRRKKRQNKVQSKEKLQLEKEFGSSCPFLYFAMK